MFPMLAIAVLMVAETLLGSCAGLEIRTSIAFEGRQRSGQVGMNVRIMGVCGYECCTCVPHVDVALFLAQNEPHRGPSVLYNSRVRYSFLEYCVYRTVRYARIYA